MREMDALAYWQEKGSAYFRELSTFGAIPDKVIRRLLEKGRVIRLDTGECLYSVGERSEAFYIVLSGTVSTWMPRQDDGRALGPAGRFRPDAPKSCSRYGQIHYYDGVDAGRTGYTTAQDLFPIIRG